LPTRGSVPALTESLILRYNPLWKLGGGTGFYPLWATQLAEADFSNIETYTFDKGVIYSHEQWRGRIRASAGIGASLDPDSVDRFDKEHASLLQQHFPQDPLTINHRVFTLFAIPSQLQRKNLTDGTSELSSAADQREKLIL
jgi:hypothetical protein